MEKKEIKIDDRDFENQIIEIPAKFPDQDKIYELVLRSYYDKNRNGVKTIKKIHFALKKRVHLLI